MRNTQSVQSFTRWVSSVSILLGISFGITDAAWATSIPVANANFSNSSQGEGGINLGGVSGWTKSGGVGGTYNPDGRFYTSPGIVDGSSAHGVIGTMNDPTVLFLYQSQNQWWQYTTSHTVSPGETYQLTVAVGARDGSLAAPFGGWKIELLDGDSVLAVGAGATAPAVGSFADVSLGYTAKMGDAGFLRIRLSEPGTTYADYDNVRLTVTTPAPVPEPESYAMMLVGLGALGFAGRRRRAK